MAMKSITANPTVSILVPVIRNNLFWYMVPTISPSRRQRLDYAKPTQRNYAAPLRISFGAFQRLPDRSCLTIKFCSGCALPEPLRYLHGKLVTFVAWDDMQVNVKDVLAGDFSITQPEVYPCALQVGPPDRRCYANGNYEQATGCLFVEFGKAGGPFHWDNQTMAVVNLPKAHEGGYLVVPIDKGARQLT